MWAGEGTGGESRRAGSLWAGLPLMQGCHGERQLWGGEGAPFSASPLDVYIFPREPPTGDLLGVGARRSPLPVAITGCSPSSQDARATHGPPKASTGMSGWGQSPNDGILHLPLPQFPHLQNGKLIPALPCPACLVRGERDRRRWLGTTLGHHGVPGRTLALEMKPRLPARTVGQ